MYSSNSKPHLGVRSATKLSALLVFLVVGWLLVEIADAQSGSLRIQRKQQVELDPQGGGGGDGVPPGPKLP